MKNLKFIKTTSLLAAAFAIFGMYALFTSATSENQAQQQVIAELSKELSEMKTEINILKEEDCSESVGQDCYLGEIMLFGGNFAPRGTAFCDGQLLPISPNSALFSLLGTIYGGDGRVTFALPDLRGRAVVHAGNGLGLTDRRLGAKYGAESQNIDVKVHKTSIPTGRGGSGSGGTGTDVVDNVTSGNISTVPPSAAVNYIICLEGIYPSRS